MRAFTNYENFNFWKKEGFQKCERNILMTLFYRDRNKIQSKVLERIRRIFINKSFSEYCWFIAINQSNNLWEKVDFPDDFASNSSK